METPEIKNDSVPGNPQDLDSTRKLDTKPSGHTTRLRTLFRSSSLNILSGLIRGRTADISDIVSRSGSDDSDDLKPGENAFSDDFIDLDSCLELREKIAEGGQGSIHKAYDRKLARVVAVKSMHDKLKDRNRLRNAFLSEARFTAQLDHPAIVPVHGIFGDSKRGLHLAMKLIKGSTLRQYLNKNCSLYRAMPKFRIRASERSMLPQRLDIFLRVCEAISYAHHKKIIHRDLKPENIMIGSFNETYVMDWGIAEHQSRKSSSADVEKLLGSVQYIAPELICGQPYDSRSDIYSLGLILFEIVFLKQAYFAETMDEALRKAQEHEVGTYVHYYGAHVDRDLSRIIRKALEPEPADRYQNVKALMKDIRNYRNGEEVSANPDFLFDRAVRFFRHHYALMFSSFLLLLIFFITASGFFFFRKINSEVRRDRENFALSEIYSKGIHSGSTFKQQLHSLENLVVSAGWTASFLYDLNGDASSGRNVFYGWNDVREGREAPPGFMDSPVYRQKISLDAVAVKVPPGKVIQEYSPLLKKMNPLREVFFHTMLNSLTETSISATRSGAKVRDMIFHQIKPPFSWVFAGFTNGLHLGYPYRTDYSDSYDPRRRSWFRSAVNERYMRPVWGKPYIDDGSSGDLIVTCSKAFADRRNRIIGVVGADISLNWLRGMLAKGGNSGPSVKNKYLLDDSGRILVDCGHSVTWTKDEKNGSLNFYEFPSRPLLESMWRRKNGRIFSTENGTRYVYFFMEIDTVRWLYVERIDFDRFCRNRQRGK